MTFGDLQQLSHIDAKKRLSIALQVAQTESYRLDFDALIEPKRKTGSRVYEHLNSLGCVYVTTNYDRFLDVGIEDPLHPAAQNAAEESTGTEKRKLICRLDQFKGSSLRHPGTVIHLHGSLDDPGSMVLTTPQYLKHYAERSVKDFLDKLFGRYTVLFIGYQLEEWEILEYMMTKLSKHRAHEQTLFMLMGSYSHQGKTFSHLAEYYDESFGVRLVPFSLDCSEYAQLERILEDWSGSLEVGSPLLSDDLAYVLEVADE